MFSSLNYEKKYLKYKNKYQILKNQYGNILSGGECIPLPYPEDKDVITTENLFILHPSERISIQNRCYAVRSLYEWIINRNYDRLPDTQTLITPVERQSLIEAYQRLNDCNPLPDDEDVFTGEYLLNLRPSERILIQNRCYAVRGLYEWIINRNYDRLPDTQTLITPVERQSLIEAYQRLNDCNPLPDDEDVITTENLFNLHPSERISIQNRCYAVRSLYEWIINLNNDRLPDTYRLITPLERQRLIEAYREI
jgi:hypothetical protein